MGIAWLARFILEKGVWRSIAYATALSMAMSGLIAETVFLVTGPPQHIFLRFLALFIPLIVAPILVGTVIVAMHELGKTQRHLSAAYSQLEVMAFRDSLTELLNHRSFMAEAERELSRATREGRTACFMMIDIDHFKRVNDSHGHALGDAVLKAFADACRAFFRSEDLIGRLGGEEFGVLFESEDPMAVLERAEDFRSMVENLSVESEQSAVSITVSIGIAMRGAQGTSLERLIREADTALYEAKKLGRNRVYLQGTRS